MFGGFAPLPLRLGGTEEEGVSAAQWQRLANDIAALMCVRCLGVITFNNTVPPTVNSYLGCHGSGLGAAPTVIYVAVGVADITWDASYTDDHGVSREFVAVRAQAQGHAYGGSVIQRAYAEAGYGGAANVVRVTMFKPSGLPDNGIVSVAVFGTFGEQSQHTDYGGDADKRETVSESTPYAFTWYNEYTAMFGSALSQERSGYIHALKLAMARVSGAESRAAERFALNAMPTLAEDASATWCKALGVPFVDSMSGAMRRSLLASRIAAAQGPSVDAVDTALGILLGESLVQVHRYTGNDLDTPPDITRWPYGIPGNAQMDLGGGAFHSSRSHVFVEVQEPNLGDWANYRELLDVHMFRLLDTILPAHATFDWGALDSGGFIINESLLGIDAL